MGDICVHIDSLKVNHLFWYFPESNVIVQVLCNVVICSCLVSFVYFSISPVAYCWTYGCLHWTLAMYVLVFPSLTTLGNTIVSVGKTVQTSVN